MNGIIWWRQLAGVSAAVLLAAAVAGCGSLYDDSENWVVEDNDVPTYYADYDVFYLYPSYFLGDPPSGEDAPVQYLNWMKDGVSEDLRRLVSLPLGRQFGKRVRLFSPFVPQLSFNDYNALLKTAEAADWDFKWSKTPLDSAIGYTVEALEWYLKMKDADQPFILEAHGQGALILYEAMKRCSGVKPENGFVAAYFFGLPGITVERIEKDFGGRGIKPATDSDGVGVIAVCNIRIPGSKPEESFALRGGAVINPINWRTDATPALPKEHPGAVFHNRAEIHPDRQIIVRPRFCGAVVDTENALVNLTHLPPKINPPLGTRRVGTQVWGVFGMCVSRNASDRVRIYKFRHKGLKLPDGN